MSGLTHLWQRFLLASSLLVGLLMGVACSAFGYSNKTVTTNGGHETAATEPAPRA